MPVGVMYFHPDYARKIQGGVHRLGGVVGRTINQRQSALTRQALGDAPTLLLRTRSLACHDPIKEENNARMRTPSVIVISSWRWKVSLSRKVEKILFMIGVGYCSGNTMSKPCGRLVSSPRCMAVRRLIASNTSRNRIMPCSP